MNISFVSGPDHCDSNGNLACVLTILTEQGSVPHVSRCFDRTHFLLSFHLSILIMLTRTQFICEYMAELSGNNLKASKMQATSTVQLVEHSH